MPLAALHPTASGSRPSPPVSPPREMPRGRLLLRLFWEWFKISLFVIGGGYAIIVAADDIFGRRLHWLEEGELIDHLPVFQTIPGLIAGNSAIYVGRKVAGRLGAFVALVGVALPSYLIILAVAYGFAQIPVGNRYVQGAFIGLRSALAGLVLATLAKSWVRVMHGAYPYAMLVASFLLLEIGHVNPAFVLVGAMLIGIFWKLLSTPAAPRAPGESAAEPMPRRVSRQLRKYTPAAIALAVLAGLCVLWKGLASIFFTFMKFGALCFGGGYVLMPLYIDEFVEKGGWISLEEFGNLLAITQATPGPVSVNAATFFGFRLGQRLDFFLSAPIGSLVATVGLLFPSYFLLLFALNSLERFRESRIVKGLMWGVSPATLGLMSSALLVFLEMSVFSTSISWGRAWAWLCGLFGAAEPALPEAGDATPFFIRPLAIVLVAAVAWIFRHTKIQIVAIIVSTAILGALLFPLFGN